MSRQEFWLAQKGLTTFQQLDHVNTRNILFWNRVKDACRESHPTIALMDGGFRISVQTISLIVREHERKVEVYHHCGHRDELFRAYADQVTAKKCFDQVVSELLGL